MYAVPVGVKSSRLAASIRRTCPVVVHAGQQTTTGQRLSAHDPKAATVTIYTITITPDDSAAMTTTLRLDTAGGDATLTDLHLHKGSGLSTGELPAIDYGLLLRAVAASAPTPVIAAPQPAALAAEVVPKPGRARASRSTRSTATAPAAAAVVEAAPTRAPRATRSTRATGRRTASKAAPAETPATPAPAAKARSRRAGAAKTATPSAADAAKARKTAKSAPARKATRAASAGERAYRRMPEDFAAVYAQAGNAAAVADHYSVPRHTAHGWIRRLRDQNTAG
jgi:hypothetical protein